MHSNNYRIFVITHVEERPVRSGQQGASEQQEGLMSRVCQAGRVDCRLASCMHPATEAWAAAMWILGLLRAERAKQDWGLRWWASANTNTRGVKADGICKSGRQLSWTWFHSGNSSGGPLQSWTLETPVPPGWLLHFLLFLASSACLSFAGGWVGLDQSRSFEWCLGEAGLSSHPHFFSKGISCSW